MHLPSSPTCSIPCSSLPPFPFWSPSSHSKHLLLVIPTPLFSPFPPFCFLLFALFALLSLPFTLFPSLSYFHSHLTTFPSSWSSSLTSFPYFFFLISLSPLSAFPSSSKSLTFSCLPLPIPLSECFFALCVAGRGFTYIS